MRQKSGDTVDFRVMLAREVAAEQAWRIEGHQMRPADFAEVDRQGYEAGNRTTIREQVEEWCGEPLA